METRKKIAVLFGGRSVEHEISVVTAHEVLEALDPMRFEAIPVYIDQTGRWLTGTPLLKLDFYRNLPAGLETLTEVTLLPLPGIKGLVKKDSRKGWGRIFAAKESEIISIDAVIPAFHGQFGEDGCIQGLLELADIPYTGCPVPASAIAMNKFFCKSVLRAAGIPSLPAIVIHKDRAIANLTAVRSEILAVAGLEQFPLFVKPCNLGSSVGIGVARDESSLHAALLNVFKYDAEAIVEPCVTALMEINVSVLEGNPPRASVTEIPVASAGALTYEDKYMRGGGKGKKGHGTSQGMAGLTRVIDPNDLDGSIKAQVQAYAVKAFSLLGCRGLVRFDFIVDTATNSLYFNELNPFPGSLAYYLWEKSNPPLLYTEFLSIMVTGAFEMHARKQGLERSIGFKALR
jgi:D-alanine-D-alanine ligase